MLLNKDERKTIETAQLAYISNALSRDEFRAILAHFRLIAPKATEVAEESTTPQPEFPCTKLPAEAATSTPQRRFEIGDRVIHEQWGEGVIRRYYKAYDADIAPWQVAFEDGHHWCTEEKLDPVNQPRQRFAVGDRVHHNQWGYGTIEIDDMSTFLPYRVHFPNAGRGDDFYQWVSAGSLEQNKWRIGQRVRWECPDGPRIGTITSQPAPDDNGILSADIRWDDGQVYRDFGIEGDIESPVVLLDEQPATGATVDLTPAPLAIGDSVRDNDGDCGIIKAIDGNTAWVWYDDLGDYYSTELRDLTRL